MDPRQPRIHVDEIISFQFCSLLLSGWRMVRYLGIGFVITGVDMGRIPFYADNDQGEGGGENGNRLEKCYNVAD